MASACVLHITSRMAKLVSCEIAVAIDAPAMPMSNTKISSGSRSIFSTPPEIMPTMPYVAKPWKRRRLFIDNDPIMNGAARKIYRA